MDFSRPTPRRPSEPALPMINVVFLLLIFFLMSAQIAPPPPFDIQSPEAGTSEQAATEHVVYIAADGALAYGDHRGDAIWPVLAAHEAPREVRVLIRADAGLPAREVAGVLGRLGRLGFTQIHLATVAK